MRRIIGKLKGENEINPPRVVSDGKSLLLDFGQVPSKENTVGRWIMETSLTGSFTAFEASFLSVKRGFGYVDNQYRPVTVHVLVVWF